MRSVDTTRAAMTLVRGRWIFSGAAPGDTTLDEGAILIDAGTVREVAPWRVLREKYPEARVIGSDRHAVIPGFVNSSHRAFGGTALQHALSDQPADAWAFAAPKQRRYDVYLATLLGAAEQLRSGVTSVVDSFYGEGSADRYAADVNRVCEGYAQSGLRAAVAAGFRSTGFLVPGVGEDRRFLESLPDGLQSLALERIPAGNAMDEGEFFDLMIELHDRYQKHSRVSTWFGPPGPQWVSERFLQNATALAEQWEAGVHTTIGHTVRERAFAEQFYGAPSAMHLARLEVLTPRLTIASAVWLEASELDVLAEHGVSVCHRPSSDLRLGTGIAAVDEMRRRNINVALGTGGFTLNDDNDFFTELRLAHHLRSAGRVGAMPSPLKDTWHLATAAGSVALGRGGTLGRIAVGGAADLVMLDLDRLEHPWAAPEIEPLDLVLGRAGTRDVDTVLIAGEIVFEHGRPTRFDVAEAANALAHGLSETPYQAEAVDIIDELLPRITEWTSEKEKPNRASLTRYNAE